MSELSIGARLRFKIKGIEVLAPKEWQDINFSASFENGNIQPTIEVDSFTFGFDGAKIIKEHKEQGRIFEGIPFTIETYNINRVVVGFRGIIDLSNDYTENENGTVTVKIGKLNGLDDLNTRLSGLTLSYLESIGKLSNGNYTSCEYVVEKPINLIELVITNIVTFLMVKELENQIRETAKDVSAAAGMLSSGITGSIGAAIWSVAVAIIQIAYSLVLLAAILKLANQIFQALLPIVRTHKTLNYREALKVISEHLGYKFESPIKELDRYYYLPSNQAVDEVDAKTGFIAIARGTQSGVPNPSDYGYTASEFFDLCKRLFNAKIRIVEDRLIFRTKNDPYWRQTTTYKMPNVLLEQKRYNTSDIVFSRLIKYDVDPIADLWTVENFKGTNYEIITEDKNIRANALNLIKNHETIEFPVALGNRKQSLNAIEKTLAELGSIIDTTVGIFGGNSNFKKKVKNRIGVLKVGSNNTTKPKLLYLSPDGSIPQNHREKTSAKYLWDTYINEKSLVSNEFIGQKSLYSIQKLPFGLESFNKTIENSNFTMPNGANAEFISINWNIAKDSAECEIKVDEVYTENLTETTIEQS